MPGWVCKILYLLPDDGLVQRDQRSDPCPNQGALIAAEEGGVNPCNVRGVDESAKRDALAKDGVRQQGFHDVESQRVKGIGEVRRVAAAGFWLAGEVDKVSREQRDQETRKGPERRGPPERCREQQEEIGDLDGVVRSLEERNRGDRKRVAIGEQLRSQEIELE